MYERVRKHDLRIKAASMRNKENFKKAIEYGLIEEIPSEEDLEKIKNMTNEEIASLTEEEWRELAGGAYELRNYPEKCLACYIAGLRWCKFWLTGFNCEVFENAETQREIREMFF